jgi:hypothetical protein
MSKPVGDPSYHPFGIGAMVDFPDQFRRVAF